jgi:FO synthase
MSYPSASEPLPETDALMLASDTDTQGLMRRAAQMRDEGHGTIITYSRKVFIPLTHLCRDVCHYCTFARPPRQGEPPFMLPEQVLAVVRKGEASGCVEALFTLGDKPELRYQQAREALTALGYGSTLEYLGAMAALVVKESALLPHLNPGVMTPQDLSALRPAAASMGLMLEELSERLFARGGAHFGSLDKLPAARLATIRSAGELRIPFTSGLLVGIGESRRERIETLLALRRLHETYEHIQEIIIQPFRAKVGTPMARSADASADDLLWTIAVARLIFGPRMNVQTPPNLASELITQVVDAGINDWGGVSPVTVDYVNPEAPWPHIEPLNERMRAHGRVLVQRLPLYKAYASDLDKWADPRLHRAILNVSDSEGMARDCMWSPGNAASAVESIITLPAVNRRGNLDRLLAAAQGDRALSETEIVQLFVARDRDFDDVCQAADELRRRISGDTIGYVVNRNINYTNVCSYRCAFCAFSKGKAASHLRGLPYELAADEIARRVHEAWMRGATEVCMQGGIHPDYTGETYLTILQVVKNAVPRIHVHAFSPLEILHGARTLQISIEAFLAQLRDRGLGSLPGTAAEILDDEVRRIICPDKLQAREWLDVVETAHRIGLKTTATIMFGHIEGPKHWARHLLQIRRLQEKTGGFTEFVPLPFVHMEAPIYFKGLARRGPTLREAILMHAVARLVLNPVLINVQVSWVKMGVEGAKACLQAGANDLGGTLMNESISRAAGAAHGEELSPEKMDAIALSIGRRAEQRTTLYWQAPPEQKAASYGAAPLAPVTQTPALRHSRLGADRRAESVVS